MAITGQAFQRLPVTDDLSQSSASAVLDKDASDFAALQAGDVVLVFVNWRVTSGTVSVTTDGGQVWTEEHDAVDTLINALYSCVFDGTWDADPAFTFSGAATGRLMVARAYRGVDSTTLWDVSPTWATDSDTSYDIADYNTVTDGALAIVSAGSGDNNTWSVDNGFTSPSGNIYWRNSAGADHSIVYAEKTIATAGAVGATTMTQDTLGADSGYKVFGALKPAAAAAPGPAPRHNQMRQHAASGLWIPV